jgi:hypothetical protein
MANWKWDEMMTKDEEKTMENFILHLYEGFLEFGHDKYVEHIFYICVRDITRIIGVRKNFKISKKALKLLGIDEYRSMKMIEKAQKKSPKLTVNEHKIPAKKFWYEFKDKKENGIEFTRNDAKRWLNEAVIAIITKEEDEKITEKGWMIDRPDNAYEILEIELEDITE